MAAAGVCTAPIGTKLIAVAALAKSYGQGPVDRVLAAPSFRSGSKTAWGVQRYNVCPPIAIHRAPSDVVRAMHSDMFDGEVADAATASLSDIRQGLAGEPNELTARPTTKTKTWTIY